MSWTVFQVSIFVNVNIGWSLLYQSSRFEVA